MRRSNTQGLALAMVMWLAAGCGSDAAGPGGSNPVATNQVTVRDNNFNPARIVISAGTTVTWTWAGGNAHDIVFDDGQAPATLMTNGTHTRSFATAGTFRYRCNPHSTNFTNGMIGEITVQ